MNQDFVSFLLLKLQLLEHRTSPCSINKVHFTFPAIKQMRCVKK